ncbi:uncharacterized protein EAE98_001584 [Botrytis deweyae]|uniref:Uncharacterized protein n=1 Tax=Botrytis deweyae TaxID=2478750 RepID=A0ABQ7IY93_9HELO|nr:uncharacterized protein EAE98_001584 [Botrytis deweyae]KAF7937270.1 hypothetical protein EAE98_001584 [Botrytis deweyae]
MNTSSQNESQCQDIVSPGYLMASPVEDRRSIGSIESTGCRMATAAVLDHQVMTNHEVKPMATQNKFQTNFTSVTPVNLVSPNSGCNTNNDTPFCGKEKFEAAYYSSEMFNFFEMTPYGGSNEWEPNAFIRCNEDGSLLGEYDYFKELFDEEDENIMKPLEEEPFEKELLIVIGDD